MRKIILLHILLLGFCFTKANTVLVTNNAELKKANKEAQPGDTIVLQNGEWNNVTLLLNCTGTAAKPIVFMAQTAGKVIITGNSKLLIGGNYIIVDGLYFTRGYAGDDAIIKFRVNNDQLANHCRVTNTVINDFNNPKRMDDNYWVMLYGKNNRIDHCSFMNKKNMGVLMAVILDDARSRENFHSIDHNYFGFRLPLASNTGEMLRVGVSQHCEFNSNTQITDNFFEHCDGETEIISIKSGSNVIRNNLFKECQGSVVMRHGDNNTVENNVFLGNNKIGTGGVRVINKGHWIVNNLFYKCRGEWFRSPLSIMNGVANSPANRYVEVTDVVIANNSFIECTPIGIGIGSDTERTVAPKNVQFINNLFKNKRDPLLFNAYDNISGLSFSGNLVSTSVKQELPAGFKKTNFGNSRVAYIELPVVEHKFSNADFDSLNAISKTRLKYDLSTTPGFSDAAKFKAIDENAKSNCGAAWFAKSPQEKTAGTVRVNCGTAESLMKAIAENDGKKLFINLSSNNYDFTGPLYITQDIEFSSKIKKPISFNYPNAGFLIQVKAGYSLSFKNINLDLAAVTDFISTDTSGSSNHSNIKISNSHFSNLNGHFFTAAQSSLCDSIIVYNCTFLNMKGRIFDFFNETTNKGYYNVEILKIQNNRFLDCSGQLLSMLRGGNDESTMGPDLSFSKNIISGCLTTEKTPLIHLFGTQLSSITNNIFRNSNSGYTVIQYDDLVRSVHQFNNNKLIRSGKVNTNKFVTEGKNIVE